ncbi:MAG: hypothetical protein AB7F93_09820 [Immundisolibacter sp.]|uniref:hypothetical protein n=1 Tax=Immundisolibacter sp. TaxID=1934948 RepID=UPI003D095ACE
MALLVDPNRPWRPDWSLRGDVTALKWEQTLRTNQQRLLEAIELDPGNQHARDSLRSLREVAASLGISLPVG